MRVRRPLHEITSRLALAALQKADPVVDEMLDFIVGWLASDSARLTASLLDYAGRPAYGPQQLRFVPKPGRVRH